MNVTKFQTTYLRHKEYFDQNLIEYTIWFFHKYQELQTALNDKGTINGTLRAIIRRLSKELKKLRKLLKSTEKDRDDLKDKLQKTEQELDDARKENFSLILENSALTEKLKAANKENEKKDARIEGLESKDAQAVEELETTRKERDALKFQLELRSEMTEEAVVDDLQQEVAGLEQKLNKATKSNSEISNYPTSADMPGRTEARASINSREPSTRPRGGQKGHALHKSTLHKGAEVKVLKVKKVPSGAIKMTDENDDEYWVIQEIDLLVQTRVKESHLYLDKENGIELDQRTMEQFKINPVIYSADFKAKVHYLNIETAIPVQRLARCLNVLSDGQINLKPSTICKWNDRFVGAGEKEWKLILADILKEEKVHVDETGIKINKVQYWIHTLCNDSGCVFFVTRSRGDKENGPMKYLSSYKGTVVSDHFSSYLTLEDRAECMAHIERYMKSGIVLDENEMCRGVLDVLHKMKHRKEEYIAQGKKEMPEEEADALVQELTDALDAGFSDYEAWAEMNKKRANVYKPDYVNTWKRMREDIESYVRFIRDFNIPYTNNEAERQMRKVKSKKNSSGQFVSERGAKSYTIGLSMVQTAKIRGENPLRALERILR